MEQKFDFVEVTLDKDHFNMVREIYRVHKEQANKVFNLASGISSDEDIMECIKDDIENDIVLMAIDKTTGNYAGCLTFDNISIYNNEIISCGIHIIVNKKYWGKDSRRIIKDCYQYVKKNMKPIKRMEAYVPSNNFGIIKLLKDVGFKIEGTLKNRLIYKDRNNNPKLYNELLYSNLDLEGTMNG